ncbi:MAG: hypothetical protein KBS86_01205 [Proteobacteria bacterium]|nr:hypothetical protein [Candidatus Enterousia scatequi]
MMTPEQLKWNKHQWAEYLDCSVQLYKRARNFADCHYGVLIRQNKDGKYNVVLTDKTYEKNRFGHLQRVHIIHETSQKTFDNYNDAVRYANETFIPSLEFKPYIAQAYKVPTKILQTLHVNTR